MVRTIVTATVPGGAQTGPIGVETKGGIGMYQHLCGNTVATSEWL
jgi:hypothetical protein